MAEERNVGLARAHEQESDDEATKAELQRRMDEARENITQTVSEIKDTVVNQYQQVRESISESLDWREQYRRRPVPFTVGAFGAGILLGYSVAGAFGGGDEDEEDYDARESFGRIDRGFDQLDRDSGVSRAYAATPITGSTYGAAAYQRPAAEESAGVRPASPAGSGYPAAGIADVGPDTRPSYSSGYEAATAQQASGEEVPQGPGLFERFKETKAYDRLQEELSTLGNRAVEELSRTAQTVIVPAILAKLKDMIGIDLSTQREVAQRAKVEQETERVATASASGNRGGGQSSGQGF